MDNWGGGVMGRAGHSVITVNSVGVAYRFLYRKTDFQRSQISFNSLHSITKFHQIFDSPIWTDGVMGRTSHSVITVNLIEIIYLSP